MGHSKSRNEEMRNEEWERRKWGNEEMENGNQTADILLLQSSRESQCPCMHSSDLYGTKFNEKIGAVSKCR